MKTNHPATDELVIVEVVEGGNRNRRQQRVAALCGDSIIPLDVDEGELLKVADGLD